MRLKIFYSFDMNALELAINAFIENKVVKDIRFTDTFNPRNPKQPITTAYILYEDIQNAPAGTK